MHLDFDLTEIVLKHNVPTWSLRDHVGTSSSRFDAWLLLSSCGICMYTQCSVFCCAKYGKWKWKWFEIKLASQKIVVMEEGKIDELFYNDVVDILNLRFWTWQEREACCDSKEICPVLKSINFILIPWIDLFGQYHVGTWQNIKFLVSKTAVNNLIYFKW